MNDVYGDMILYKDTEYPDHEYDDAVGLASRLWDKVDNQVIIPYIVPQETSEFDRTQIDRAIDEFHQKTCIR